MLRGSPEIHTERLLLRPFRSEDGDQWHRKIGNDAEVMRHLPARGPITRNRSETIVRTFVDHWDQHGFGVWAVLEADGEALIGHCGLRYLPRSPEIELLYGFARESWGKGLATEAATAALRYGFDVCGFDRIVALALPENTASVRVMEKLRMQRLGETHEFGLDVVRYAVTAGAWRSSLPADG